MLNAPDREGVPRLPDTRSPVCTRRHANAVYQVPARMVTRRSRNTKRTSAPEPAGLSRTPIRARLLLFGLLAVIVLVTYSNSSRGLLLLDNERVILKDTRIRAATLDNIRHILAEPYWQAILGGLYRPFTTLSYLFNYAVLGSTTSAEGYHWTNLLLHLMNAALVFALGLSIFEETWLALTCSWPL